MGIRASSGGQLGGTSTGGVGLTPTQVQEIISQSVDTSNLVQGLALTSAYNPATGKIIFSLGTPGSPITHVLPASIDVKKSGTLVGTAESLNFTGSGVGVISVDNNIATINITGGGGGGSGVSISNVIVNGAGHLIIFLDDGNTIDAGLVTGANGASGAAGVGVASAAINGAGHLIMILTNGSTLDTGIAVGPKGDTGVQGIQGIQGTQGVQGTAGADGVQGATGANGTPGAKGDTGSAGPAGRNISSATIDSNGFLQLTLSDSTILNAGHVVGAQGATGASGTQGIQGIQGIQGPAGSSVVSGTVNGSGHLVLTKSDSTTIDVGSIVGPQGIQGNTGATGVQGSAGTSYTINNKSGQVQVYGLGATTQAGYDLEVDLANKANKLTTARNIALSGKVTGLTSFDGSGNVTMLTSLNGVTTTDVSEGTNQYFTSARARSALSASTGLSFNASTGVFSLNANSDQITEGSNNLYFNNNRFDNRLGQSTLAQFSDVANASPTTGQALIWNGNAWTPGNVSGGSGNTGSSAGVFKATVQIEYDANGNLTNVSILNGGISAVITTATSTTATVTFTFTGSTCSPLGIQMYGYQRANNVYVTRALANDSPTRTIAAGGASGAPTAFSGFDSITNTLTLGLTKAVTGASAGIGQTTHCVIQFLLSSI